MSERGNFQLGQLSAADLVSALQDVAAEYAYHASASRLALEHFQHYVSSSDLPSLAIFLTSLTSAVEVLDYISLHQPLSAFISSIQHILSTWDSSDDYGPGQSMELFGSLQLSLWAMQRRYSLPYRIPSEVMALEALSAEHKELVSSWITALYGNEGIDDELLHSTHPRIMLGLACTVVHQSLQAMAAGIIDKDTLNGGLSYFTQDLLSFTIPGLIKCMRDNKVDEEIVKSLLTDSIPLAVLELVDGSATTSKKSTGVNPIPSVTEPANPAHPLQSLKAALDASQSSRLAIIDRILQSPDLLLSSLLLSMPVSGPPLLKDATRIYLPRLFQQAQQQTQMQMQGSLLPERLEQVADCLACALHRHGGHKEVEKQYAAAQKSAKRGCTGLRMLFWERVRQFSI